MKSKKILYVMHISWGWLKQRPHFLAESLNEENDVEVICWPTLKDNTLNNDIKNIKVSNLLRLPFDRNRVIYKLNNFICKIQLFFKESIIKIWLSIFSIFLNFCMNSVI